MSTREFIIVVLWLIGQVLSGFTIGYIYGAAGLPLWESLFCLTAWSGVITLAAYAAMGGGKEGGEHDNA